MKANFDTGLKICSKCKRELPLDSFYKKKASNDGLFLCCKECWNSRCRVYNHTDNHKKSQDKYSQSEKGKIARYNINHKTMEYRKKWYYDKRSLDQIFKAKSNLRVRYHHFLKDRSFGKSSSVLKYLGCSFDLFYKYIESQFQEGMSWENYGEWHVDHIIPLAYFNFEEKEDWFIAWNYRNLQPLWKKDNLEKSSRVPNNIEELINNLKREINGNS